MNDITSTSKRRLIKITTIISVVISLLIICGGPFFVYMSNIEYKEGLLNGVLSCKNTLSSQNTALNTEAIIKTCIQNTRHHEKTSISYEIVSDLSKVPRFSSFLNYTETDISNPEVDNAQHVILTTNIIDDTDHFILIVILSLWFGIWSHLLIKIIPIKALEDSIQVLEKYVDENYKIRKEKEVAEESVRVRTMFLAKMSHELRTPLNGVIGMLDLVAHSNSESEKSINLKLAKKSADDLLMIVNDILDFSKIDEGELKVNHAPFDIHELLTTTKAILSVQSMQKNIPILLDIDSLVPKYIVSDQTRLRQILINLVGNALKFTHQGKITISVTYTVNTLVISVSDTGIGISSEKLESVFNPFTQAETETSRTYGGTGLGLTITKQLTHLLNGSIEVESKIDVGTVFTIKIKLPEQNSLPDSSKISTPINELDLTDVRILVAEDNETNLKIVTSLLKRRGAIVQAAKNGLEAVEATATATANFDLILMDIEMPIMSGIEASHEIRALGITIPIVALTAHAVEGFKTQCFEAGMNGFITKPIVPKVLFQEVGNILHLN